jgi:prevent-host-death family protein
MASLTASKARQTFSEILNRVAYRGERILIERNGKDVAAIVPVEDLVRLESLLEEERKQRLEAARKKLHARYGKTFKILAK